MRIVGLTGGIASGKSTVARMLRGLGAEVVDADVLAREVVAPSTPGLAEIVAGFGREVLLADGSLDRKRLGAAIFADAGARARLNAIVHPRVREAFLQRTSALADRGVELLVYEVPLLIENRLHEGLAAVIVVSVPEAVQLQRLRARDAIGEPEARARLAAQLPLAQKIAAATHVIDNSGTLENTEQQVRAVWAQLTADR